MRSIKKLLKSFLQPWSTVHKPQISSLTKAVIVGCMVSVSVLAAGWTLFSSSSDLRNRSVFSVLVSPDYRFIEAVPDRLSRIGTCSQYSFNKPVDSKETDILRLPIFYCRGWILDESSFSMSGYLKHWTATKYEPVRGHPSYRLGSSRNDALSHAKDVWVNVGSSLLMPIVVLLVMQMGVLVGYQYFRRSSKADASDGEDS